MIEAKLLIAISFTLVIILAMIDLVSIFYFYARAEECRMNGKHHAAKQWNRGGNILMGAGLIAISAVAYVVIKAFN